MQTTPVKKTPLSAAQIRQLLDDCLEVEFSFLRTETAATILAGLERAEQDYILAWVQRVASTNIQLAYQFITRAVNALDNMDRRMIESWALYAMDTYDQAGLHKALAIIRNLDDFVRLYHQKTAGAVYEENASVLLHFARGLSGRRLQLQESSLTYTDSETIYLPAVVSLLNTPQENFLVYKAMVAYHWAQARFGTFHLQLGSILDEQPEAEKFLSLFHALDTVRLDAILQRELPGLARHMRRIKQQLQQTPSAGFLQLANELVRPRSTVDDVLRLTRHYLHKLDPPSPCFYQGVLQPQEVEECRQQRLQKEKRQFRSVLRKLVEESKGLDSDEQKHHRFETRPKHRHYEMPDELELTLDGQAVPLPDNVKGLITSIVQDLGEIPAEYLQPAGAGEYQPDIFGEKNPDPDDVWKGTYHEKGAFLYKEWDFRRQHYRKNWCAVREKEIQPVYDTFIGKTLNKYQGLIKHLRKTFEAMRDEDRMLKRQVQGDDVDIDALVEALADAHDGREMSDRLFTRMHRSERNIAVIFMVDMSGSTKGWINEAERESLLLLAEALETLGDRYAIYGFSGMARKRCEIYRIKEFAQTYNEEVKARINGITPQDYTRMGFAIRHLCHILNQVDARTRILITLSDGKPDDYDNYRGEYGIEDTRRALIEARRDGIHPYCITIDKEAREYLPHMYGAAAYTVIDDVRQLPLKVADIYRRLTT